MVLVASHIPPQNSDTAAHTGTSMARAMAFPTVSSPVTASLSVTTEAARSRPSSQPVRSRCRRHQPRTVV
jgi:hypothetical protein